MKLRTVGLLVLAAAHMSAFALPNTCLKNYRKTASEVNEILKRLGSQETAVLATGVGGGVVGTTICIVKTRSVTGAVLCPAVFLGLSYVAYQYALDLERQMSRALDASAIYRIYQGFVDKNKTTNLEADAVTIVAKGEVSAAQVEAAWIAAMDSGELCDSKGRPNKTLNEVSQLIADKFKN